MFNSVDDPWGHYAEWNKPVTGQTMHSSTYVRNLKQLNSKKQTGEWWFTGSGGRGKGSCCSNGILSVTQDD